MSFVFHLAGVAPCGFQCPFDFYTVCRLDFSLLEVKKASTIVVSLRLGDCQCPPFERKAFEVLQGLFAIYQVSQEAVPCPHPRSSLHVLKQPLENRTSEILGNINVYMLEGEMLLNT